VYSGYKLTEIGSDSVKLANGNRVVTLPLEKKKMVKEEKTTIKFSVKAVE